MNPFICNMCGFGLCNKCGKCDRCNRCDCKKSCGCPESILSIEADSTNPTKLRFNLGGRSVWYDFDSVVKAGETCTTLTTDSVARNLVYNAECQNINISGSQLGSLLHLADIGDVDEKTIGDNAVLVYRKDANCAENCDGGNGWVGVNLSEEGQESLDYIMGSDRDGDVHSLMPPANGTNKFYYLTWAKQDKAKWGNIRTVSNVPTDGTYKYPLYLDPTNGEIVAVKEHI